ncbi:protein artemis [Nilaparvata lugens]|uniref:protein artemis n=1 Tax=Nilaparvata lugens TaxID=108931 RepID=UPI00193E768B|nr:protein artemis [Nilaparvata lugens]XP_039278192.1 protein artemis [Nilaparvata lugens]XP_039278193.1 protein artemis [Nilaparvata lugens]
MSTFNGRLQNPELNFIAIDDFKPNNHDASVFFVSHAHSDHLEGFGKYGGTLFDSNSNKTLYCSSITKRLLTVKFPNIQVDSNVVSIDVGEPCILHSPRKNSDGTSPLITVSALPTLHVLGSVMFLFECQDITALYTGDFRIHNASDVSKMKWLHDKDGKPLKITDLYLDTTFADKLYNWFPKRDDATAKIIELSEEWLDRSLNHHVSLSIVAYYGYERLIMDVSKKLNTKLLVNVDDFPHFKYISEMDGSVIFYSKSSSYRETKRPRIDSNNRSGRIHVCFCRRKGVKRCDFCSNSSYKVREVKPCAFSFNLKPYDHANIISEKTENGYTNYKVAYATHCSLTELRCFINYLKPTNIHPSVVPDSNSAEQIVALLLDNAFELNNSFDVNNCSDPSHTETENESDTSDALSLESPPI